MSRQPRRESTRADRVAEARHLQNQRLSVKEIAKVMGMGVTTIYTYFEDPTGEKWWVQPRGSTWTTPRWPFAMRSRP
jgi:hypothetical protein